MRIQMRRYVVLAVGAAIGLVAAFLQTIEKLRLIENKNAALPCNINDVFSCSTVLNAPQSSLFGFPNSLICMIVFTIFLTVGIAGLMGSRLTVRALYSAQALALFMLAFALWFLFTSTYVIGAICIFCLFCFLGLLMLNGALWRLNVSASTSGRWSNFLHTLSDKGLDVLLWLALGVVLISAIMMKFYIL